MSGQPDESVGDMTSIKDATKQRAKSVFDKEIEKLFSIWKETGIKEEILNTYADQVINHIIGLMKDMVNESAEKKQNLLKSIKSTAQAARKLSKELGMNFITDVYDNLPLIDMEEALKEEVVRLQHLKDHRLKFIEELKAKEMEYCKKLGKKCTGFSCELPTEEEITEFKNYLHSLETEINHLAEVFKDTRSYVLKMMEELQITPALDFENMVCHNHHNFVYSSSNMNKLRDLKERLEDQVEHAKSQVQEKKQTLNFLWDYLEESEEHRKAFFKNYPGYSLITLSAIETEIKRCREKRSQNVANYVNKLRVEIEKLWKLCKFSELQKKAFTAMKCQTYTDDLLVLHEMEVEKLQKYYNSNKKIFELISEWEAQFEKLKELDQRANDPDRYHNRGGQLLLEEKERKAAEKKLPKIESQLLTLAEEYENLHKKTFLINGFSMKEFMDSARESYDIEKENMKLARKQAKDKSAKKTLSTSKRTPGVSMLRITPASTRLRTPGINNMSRRTPLTKRKLQYDTSPDVSISKKRAVSTEKQKNTVLCNKVRRSGRIAGGAVCKLNASGKVIKKNTTKKRRSKNETTLSVSYGNFQEHLDNFHELRSSVLPSEAPTPDMKTPAKPVRRKVLASSTPAAPNSIPRLRVTPRNAPSDH